jgi:hypothetical protein
MYMRTSLVHYFRERLLIAALVFLPLLGAMTSGCTAEDTPDPVVKTTRLDEMRQKQDSLHAKKKAKDKPKIQSFGKHEPVDV